MGLASLAFLIRILFRKRRLRERGDSICSSCHTGTNSALDGTVTIDGVPSLQVTGETYTLTVTINKSKWECCESRFPIIGITDGFQYKCRIMVVLDPSTTEIKTVSEGATALHKLSPDQILYHLTDWTAPATVGAIPQIKFMQAPSLPMAIIKTLKTESLAPMYLSHCSQCWPINDWYFKYRFYTLTLQMAPLTVNITGGVSPYNVVWSNGETGKSCYTNSSWSIFFSDSDR